tara:strand:+ start:2224 stop:3030 length:807 start_codon:yes stop_codon:yes gene_type:complete
MNSLKYIIIISMLNFVCSSETASDRHLGSIDVENRLGNFLTSDIQLIDEANRSIILGDFFTKKLPTVLVMAYYECPMLCTLVLNGLSSALSKIDLIPGKDYNALTVSIDPGESPSLAKDKKINYINNYFRDTENQDFWTFAVSDQQNIDKLTTELGFNYSYDSKIDQYAHSAVVYVITEDGMISKQIFGISPSSNDIKLAILSASKNTFSSIFDKILLYCYQYDPMAGGYSMVASNAMKIAGAISVVIIIIFISILWIKERINFERKI